MRCGACRQHCKPPNIASDGGSLAAAHLSLNWLPYSPAGKLLTRLCTRDFAGGSASESKACIAWLAVAVPSAASKQRPQMVLVCTCALLLESTCRQANPMQKHGGDQKGCYALWGRDASGPGCFPARTGFDGAICGFHLLRHLHSMQRSIEPGRRKLDHPSTSTWQQQHLMQRTQGVLNKGSAGGDVAAAVERVMEATQRNCRPHASAPLRAHAAPPSLTSYCGPSSSTPPIPIPSSQHTKQCKRSKDGSGMHPMEPSTPAAPGTPEGTKQTVLRIGASKLKRCIGGLAAMPLLRTLFPGAKHEQRLLSFLPANVPRHVYHHAVQRLPGQQLPPAQAVDHEAQLVAQLQL